MIGPIQVQDKIYQVDGFSIEVATTRSIEHFKHDWLNLQNNTNTPFFLTWSWMSCWVKSYQPLILAIIARHKKQTVAIGFFTQSNDMRHRLINSKQLRLHQMGDSVMDQIWMEYNDFICNSRHRTQAVNACIQVLHDMDFKWDEIVLSMMSSSRGNEIIHANESASIYLRCPSYATNLEKIRRSGKSYLETLASNTRYQIRRSIRHYEELHGKLTIIAAGDVEEAVNFFHQIRPYHVDRWDDSGYKNPQFVKFHENLIRADFIKKNIVLLKVLSGQTTVGIMYYHIVGKNVYFYLHGLLYETDPKLKPGLVAHSLATQYFLDAGMHRYDYMGGYSQYKIQLAKHSEDLVTVVIQRPRSRFRLENIARKIKQRIIPNRE